MANNEPKKGGILRAYLNFNVLYKILIGLVIGAVAGIILAASGVTALPKWISMFGTIFNPVAEDDHHPHDRGLPGGGRVLRLSR